MPKSELKEPVIVELDMDLTRRSRTHAVVNGHGEQVHHAKRFSEILVWLADQGQDKALLVDGDERFYVVFHRPPK